MSNGTHIRQQRPADSIPTHWTERHLPDRLLPYARLMRLERPIGWQLLVLPGLWSIALAGLEGASASTLLWLAALFTLGAIIMRGAGCVYNDIVDHDIDARVERTRNRPIPAGQVSLPAAWRFLVLLLLAGLGILLLLNPAARVLGASSLLLVAIYPFMKRFTYWPQLFLGLAFNWPALLGWVAVRGRLDLPAVLLYLGGVFWTLAYDTIYAHQDRADDLIAGVKSTALRLGSATPRWLAGFFTAALVLFALAGWAAGAGTFWYLGLLAAALHATWQVRGLDIDDPKRCLQLFRANRDFGLIILSGAVLDLLLRVL
jgi:4-hydroxybenzoate polyprenyltransferase